MKHSNINSRRQAFLSCNSGRRHNDSRAQWGYLQDRRKVQAVLDSILGQVPEMDIKLFAL